jgi:catechol 2,3-dioxygenase-like lactoylglutathione lyase family enzyme
MGLQEGMGESKNGDGLLGIPSATTIDDVGYTVPNLDEAVAFFTDVLGFEVASRHEDPVEFPEDDRMTRWFGVHPRASVRRYAFLRRGAASTIELVEWHAPDRNTVLPEVSDAGGHHLALAVTDLNAARAYLASQAGVRVQEPSDPGFFFFFTPWGLPMQIVASSR